MAALTSDRNTIMLAGDIRSGTVAAGQLIYGGAIVMRNATGYVVKGATASGLVGIGRAEQRVDNSAGADGAVSATYRPGTFRFGNSAGVDQIARADIGAVCYVVDDQTVAKTDGTAARSPAGVIEAVDEIGVYVRFDEALTHNLS